MSKSNHPSVYYCRITCFGTYLYSITTYHGACLNCLGDLFYSAGPHGKLKCRVRIWKKKKMLNSPSRQKFGPKKFLAVGKACIATFWPTLGFKGRKYGEHQLVLNREGLNFCIQQYPTAVFPRRMNKALLFVVTAVIIPPRFHLFELQRLGPFSGRLFQQPEAW